MNEQELLTLLEKAGITTANTQGLLNTEQSNAFIDTVIDQSNFLKTIRVEKNIGRARDLDNIGLGSRLLHKPIENEEPSDDKIRGILTGKRTLTPEEIMLPINISLRWLEENIEKEAVENTITQMAAKQVGNDLVDALFNCDTATNPADPDYDFLSMNDGIIKLLDSDPNKQYYSRASNTDWKDTVFPSVLDVLPDKYQDEKDLVFLVSRRVDSEYRRQLSDRVTALGDNYLVEKPNATYEGIPLIRIPKLPYGTVILTPLSNLAIGFGREISYYREFKPRARRVEITITAKVDFNYILTEKIAYCK